MSTIDVEALDELLFKEVIPYNKLRESLGLPLIVYKKTECLCCQKTFMSKNYPHNRVCKCCKQRHEWETGLSAFDYEHQIYNQKYKTPIVRWSELSEISANLEKVEKEKTP